MAGEDEPLISGVPAVAPRLRFRKLEIVGVAIIAAFPLLAIFGAFGPRTGEDRATAGDLELSVSFPRLTRVSLDSEIVAAVKNEGAKPAGPIYVALSANYLEDTEKNLFIPEPQSPYVFLLPNLAPGDSASIRIEFSPASLGLKHGRLELAAAGEEADVLLHTVVLP